MKLLIYGINFAPELTGIGKYTGELASFLAEQGHEIRVVTAPPYYPEWRVKAGYSAWQYKKEIWDGVEVIRCPLYVPHKVSGIKRLIHLASFVLSSLPIALSQAAWKPDIVFAVAPAVFAAPIAWFASKLAGSKTWLHIQDFELDAAFNLGIIQGSKGLYHLIAGMERALLRRFDTVSTISKRMMERLDQKGVDPQKVYLFPNWADVEHIFPQKDPNQLKTELGLDAEKLTVLYSGNIGRKQGAEIIIKVAEQLQDHPDIQFVLCGEGVAKAELIRQAAGLSNVHFFPLQPLERLNDLLNMPDIHVLPQRAGAADLVMPSKLTGMLASGRPVIATALPGTELFEVVNEVGLAVPPENVEALSAAILSLAMNPEKRAVYGTAGRQFVEKNWALNKVLEQFETKAHSLLSEHEQWDQKYSV